MGLNETQFFINKQVAYIGKVTFVDTPENSPLGAIEVFIQVDNIPPRLYEENEEESPIEAFIDAFTPKWEWIREEKNKQRQKKRKRSE